nr:retrovirus-related Pol polyprotein from transposon TNT 1-94 [Tanacetum cinerariifolium]
MPHVEYAPAVYQQSEFSLLDTRLVVLVFQKGDDPIDAINHMMSFLTSIVTSRYPSTNNQLRTSPNPRQQATINNERVTIQPIQERQNSMTAGSSRPYTSGSSGTSEKHRERILKEQNNVDKASVSYEQSLKIEKLKHTLSEHLKEKEYLEQKVKELNNIVFKRNQSAETVHMLTKPQFFYDHSTRQALGFQNPCHLKRVQQLKSKLYDGSVIEKSNAIVIHDSEETLFLVEESRSKMLQKQNKPIMSQKKAVKQHYVEKNKFQDKMKNVLKDNERLLEQAISVDIMNIVVYDHENFADKTVNVCERYVPIETKLQKNFINKECYDTLFKKFNTLEKHCISLKVDNQLKKEIFQRNNSFSEQSAPTFDQLFEINDLKAQTAHTDYLWHTQEETTTLREIVESERLLNPLNTSLDYAYKPVVTLVYSRKSKASKNKVPVSNLKVVQIILWYLDSGCSKHMIGDRSQLINFVRKFLGTVKFGNDHVAKIMGYCDYKIGNVTISRVYFVEGLGHNLFSVGQFCDSNLEVAFRQHTCLISNLDGVDLLTGSRGNNRYTLSLQDMMASSPICLLSKASKTKFWLWHCHLSHLNFGAINHLARQGLVRGLSKLKFEKDHLCSACAMGKSTKKSHKPKFEDTNQEKLYLLHMDLCGPMRVESVNGKKYILLIVDDYSRFTWVKFLRSKDEALDFIIRFLKMIQVWLKVPVHLARSPQQNGVIERRNHMLIEAARTMLIYTQALLFYGQRLWQPLAITKIDPSYDFGGKTPYELLHNKLPDLSFPHSSLGPVLNEMTPATISSGLVQKYSSSIPYVPPSRNDWDLLFQPMFDELLNPPPSVDHQAPEV